MLKWTDPFTTWAGFFCDYPLALTSQEKNDFFLNKFIGSSDSRQRKRIADSLGHNQDLITKYRLITKYLLEQAPNAAFKVPGYNWRPPPLLVAGRIATIDGEFSGPRIALVYANSSEGFGFYLCTHELGEPNTHKSANVYEGYCDRKNKFPRLRNRIELMSEGIPDNAKILQSIMQQLNRTIAIEPHDQQFIHNCFPDKLVSPLYPRIIHG